MERNDFRLKPYPKSIFFRWTFFEWKISVRSIHEKEKKKKTKQNKNNFNFRVYLNFRHVLLLAIGKMLIILVVVKYRKSKAYNFPLNLPSFSQWALLSTVSSLLEDTTTQMHKLIVVYSIFYDFLPSGLTPHNAVSPPVSVF